jgi:NhaP-type Na+/H+ or K+/H+ antiporter
MAQQIKDKIAAIKNAITDITSDQNRNNRNYYFFSQDNYINMYRNRVAFILYYMVFILLAISFYMNRESYSIYMIVLTLILFALLPFVIKYITQFAYSRFLELLKLFYKGNARYIEPTVE